LNLISRCSLSVPVLLAWLAGNLLFMPGARADTPAVAVVYPDIREPYRDIFLRIIKGIEEAVQAPVKQYAIKEEDGLASLRDELAEEPVNAIVALGRVGLGAAEALRSEVPVVIGAVLLPPAQSTSHYTGITLRPDPDVLFGWLKRITPQIKRITIIYNRQVYDESSIGQAREAAKAHGFVLNALPAQNLRESAALYRNVLNEINDGSDALWLPQDDSTLDDNTLLPVILKDAWEKNLVVFSSNPEHVKKGVLFSLYPDNFGLGRSLGEMALKQMQDPHPKTTGIMPLKDLLIAVNLRTAEHLGLRFTSLEKRRFNLIFPQP
jgi:putative ABC transport system substrate-binding protein